MTGATLKSWIMIPLPRPEDLPGYAEARARVERGESLFPVRAKGPARQRRSLDSLRAEHDELVAKRDRLGVTGDDTAAARLSRADALRQNGRLDRDLARWSALTKRIDFLAFRIRSYS